MQDFLNDLPNKPIFGFGGRYFNENKKLRNQTRGVFLGMTLDEGIQTVHDLLD
jgi:hypothetical protein